MNFRMMGLPIVAILVALTCSLAAEEKKEPKETLPANLESAVKSLKGGGKKAEGNTAKAKELAGITDFSMQMAALTAGKYEDLSKALAANKEGGIWCQVTPHGLAILFEFEGFEDVQGDGRDYFIGLLWGMIKGAASKSDPVPPNLAIGFVDDSGVTCILRGKSSDRKPRKEKLELADIRPFFD